MRCHNKYQPQDVPPRVVIQKSNISLLPKKLPSTKSSYEPVALHTRSRVTHNVDQPPPRAIKTQDTGPIARLTRSQTAAMTNVITPSQVDKRRYSIQFLQSLAMPILDKTSGESLKYCQLLKHPKFAHILNTSYANELGQLCQGIGKG